MLKRETHKWTKISFPHRCPHFTGIRSRRLVIRPVYKQHLWEYFNTVINVAPWLVLRDRDTTFSIPALIQRPIYHRGSTSACSKTHSSLLCTHYISCKKAEYQSRACRSINLEGFKRVGFGWLRALGIYIQDIINMQKANNELWVSLEKWEGRGGETSAAFWHPITSVSSCKALPGCLHVFFVFFLQVLHCISVSVRQTHTCRIICECMEECEGDQTEVKQRKSVRLENISIILRFKDTLRASRLHNVHTLNKWALYRTVLVL